MPLKLKFARWQKIAGYAAFSLFAFVLCMWLTFPYDAVRQRIVADAGAQGIYVQFGGIGPGLLGLAASNVRISKKIEDPNAEPPPALVLKSVTIRPSLFPPGISFGATALGGKITGALGGFGATSLRIDLDALNTADPTFKAFSGLDASGKINAHLSLDIPKSNPSPTNKNREPDLSQASGGLSLKLDQILVKGGTLTVPMMGEPTPIDLPKIGFGDLEAKLNFEKGQGKIERFQGKGEDIELLASGTIKLARQLDYTESNIELKFKVDPDFKKRLGMIAGFLTMLPADKENPGFVAAKVTGFLARPNFNPGK